jgi:GT2 family glycosyltransferase/peptidoglycan/xylan/chitin deacetylase (PgdA/CDA1 family)
MIDLSVIIVSWNARKHLINCLESIRSTAGDLSIEVIVVDNNSSDDSCAMVSKNFPEVQLIETERNLGFAKGNNLGIKESKGRYLALINSDVILKPECFQRLIAFMEQQPKVGIVGPGITYLDGAFQPSCRRLPSLSADLFQALGFDRILSSSKWFPGSHMTPREHETQQSVEVLVGCFWLVRREALEEVGGLDERFFFYGEDNDWCKRFGDMGWLKMHYREAEAIHVGGASSSNDPIRFSIEMANAKMKYWKKHKGSLGEFTFSLILLLRYSLRLLPYVFLYAWPPARADLRLKVNRNTSCIRWLCRRHFNGMSRVIKLLISIAFLVLIKMRNMVCSLFCMPYCGTVAILCYHGIPQRKQEQFRNQMDMLKRLCQPLTIDFNLPLGRKKHFVVVTFDDGFQNVFKYALPELKKRGIPSTVFIQTGGLEERPAWIKDSMHENYDELIVSRAELKNASSDLLLIGSHTVRHGQLTHLSEQQARRELIDSKSDLENLVGYEIKFLAFPHGKFDRQILEWSREAGYQRVFSSLPALRIASKNDFLFGRVIASPMDWDIEFRLKLLGAYRWMQIAVIIKHLPRNILKMLMKKIVLRKK